MPCLISDTLYALDDGGNLVGLAGRPVVAIPSAIPLSITSDGGITWKELQGNEVRTHSDQDGAWSLTLYAHAEEDPNTTDWQILLPDGIVWAGSIPAGVPGPLSLAQLKNSYGWGISNKTAQAVVTSTGPQGPAGAGGSPATPSAAGVVKQTLYIVTDYGLTGDGTTDNTAALNALLVTVSNVGGGTVYFPPGTYRCDGQIVQPYNASLGGAAPLTLRGAGNPFAAAPIARPGTSILDLRYDGTTGNAYLDDYAVIAGLQAAVDATGTVLTFTAGTAYINNPDSTAASLRSIPAPASCIIGLTSERTVGTSAGSTSGTIGNGTWFVDIDVYGNLYFTSSGAPSGSPTAGLGTLVTFSGSTPQSWSPSTNPNTIRIAQIIVGPGTGGSVITETISFLARLGKIEARNLGLFAIADLGIYCNDPVRSSDECPFVKTTLATLRISNVTFQGSKAASIGSPALQDAITLGGPGSPNGWRSALGMYVYERFTAGSVFAGYGSTISDVSFNNCRRCIYGRGSANGIFLHNLVVWNACGAPAGMGAIDFSGTATNPAYSNVLQSAVVETPAYSCIVRLGTGAATNLIDNLTGYDAVSSSLADGTTLPAGATSFPLNGTCGAPSPLSLQGVPLAIGANFPSRAERVVVSRTAAITGANPSGGATTATGTAGQSSLTVSQALGLSAGQQILIGNVIGSQDVVTIAPSFAGGTSVPLSTPLAHSHAADAVYVTPWTIPLAAATLNIHYADLVSTVVAMVRADSASATGTLVKGGSGPGCVLPASDPGALAGGHNAPGISSFTAGGFVASGVSQLSPPVNGTAATALLISTLAEYNTGLDIQVPATVFGTMHGPPIRLLDANGNMVMKLGQDNVNRLYPSIMAGSATDPGGSQPMKISGYSGTNINTDTSALVTIGQQFVTIDSHGQVNARGFSQAVAKKSAGYTLANTDGILVISASNLTVTLPAASSFAGRIFTIKNGAGITNTTLAAAGGNIDGAASPNTSALASALAVARLFSDGTDWWLM